MREERPVLVRYQNGSKPTGGFLSRSRRRSNPLVLLFVIFWHVAPADSVNDERCTAVTITCGEPDKR